MKVMAVDYGDARTGVAISDPSGSITGEALVISEWNAEILADRLCELALSRGVSVIVLGYPINMDGTRGPRAEKSAMLASMMKKRCALDVVLQDERRTTVDAHRILTEAGRRGRKRKASIDAVAASLILETYLNGLRG
ncbi:MAG: Holliday junction resolvase RuvX [Clostridiales bacterium]|jgi:putative Holliday junction resolvase|nr:Holliday junction resolvase RuvX [Clostridiales bacterium]